MSFNRTRRPPSSFVSIIDGNNNLVDFPHASPAGQPADEVMTVQGNPTGFPLSIISTDPALGSIFTATVAAVAVTAIQDVWEIVAPPDKRVRIREVVISQYTDFGDAASEILSVKVIRGFTTAGSGGSVPVANCVADAGKSSKAVILANNTTQAVNGAGVVVRASAWNITSEWTYIPDQAERIVLQPNQRLVVMITAPADSITLNSTIVWEEIV